MTPLPQQSHPLYAADRQVLDRALAHKDDPRPLDIINAARLAVRYADYPGCPDMKRDLRVLIEAWGVDLAGLRLRAKGIWDSITTPDKAQAVLGADDPTDDVQVGSGADVSE